MTADVRGAESTGLGGTGSAAGKHDVVALLEPRRAGNQSAVASAVVAVISTISRVESGVTWLSEGTVQAFGALQG